MVVRPDIDSKNASVKSALGAPITKGRAPNTGSSSQTPTASRKLCWIVSPARRAGRQAMAQIAPTIMVRKPESAKLRQFRASAAASTIAGSAIDAPSAVTSSPMT